MGETASLQDQVASREILITLTGVILLFFRNAALHLMPSAVAMPGATAARK